MQFKKQNVYALLVMGLMLITAGCANNLPDCRPVSVEPAQVPILPSAARQQPAPLWCYPTCTEAVRADSQNSVKRLTETE